MGLLLLYVVLGLSLGVARSAAQHHRVHNGYLSAKEDPRCKYVGQFLAHGDNHCKYLRCDYGNEPWHDSYGNVKLFVREMSCAPGTHVPRTFKSGYDQGNPCTERHGGYCPGSQGPGYEPYGAGSFPSGPGMIPHDPPPHGHMPHEHKPHRPMPKNTPNGLSPRGHTPHGPSPHGPSPHGHTSHGSSPYGNSPHGHAPHGNSPYGNSPHGHAPHGNLPHGHAPHGNSPHGHAPHVHIPHGHIPHEHAPDGFGAQGLKAPSGRYGGSKTSHPEARTYTDRPPLKGKDQAKVGYKPESYPGKRGAYPSPFSGVNPSIGHYPSEVGYPSKGAYPDGSRAHPPTKGIPGLGPNVPPKGPPPAGPQPNPGLNPSPRAFLAEGPYPRRGDYPSGADHPPGANYPSFRPHSPKGNFPLVRGSPHTDPRVGGYPARGPASAAPLPAPRGRPPAPRPPGGPYPPTGAFFPPGPHPIKHGYSPDNRYSAKDALGAFRGFPYKNDFSFLHDDYKNTIQSEYDGYDPRNLYSFREPFPGTAENRDLLGSPALKEHLDPATGGYSPKDNVQPHKGFPKKDNFQPSSPYKVQPKDPRSFPPPNNVHSASTESYKQDNYNKKADVFSEKPNDKPEGYNERLGTYNEKTNKI